MKTNTHPAPQHRLADLRDWLMDRIDGGEEMRGEDGLISDFIRQIDALPSSEMGAVGLEPRGCPTPGACSAVDELADIKQRLLPQFAGRAQRAEHERDAAQVAAVAAERDARFAEHERDVLLEQLIDARSAMQQSYGCLWRYTGSSNPMFLQARKMLLARLTKEQQAIGIRYANELFGPTTEHEILHSDCSHDAAPSTTEETAIGNARYEYLRTLNPREFAALYNEALHGTADNFDDLVDRYRDAEGRPE